MVLLSHSDPFYCVDSFLNFLVFLFFSSVVLALVLPLLVSPGFPEGLGLGLVGSQTSSISPIASLMSTLWRLAAASLGSGQLRFSSRVPSWSIKFRGVLFFLKLWRFFVPLFVLVLGIMRQGPLAVEAPVLSEWLPLWIFLPIGTLSPKGLPCLSTVSLKEESLPVAWFWTRWWGGEVGAWRLSRVGLAPFIWRVAVDPITGPRWRGGRRGLRPGVEEVATALWLFEVETLKTYYFG
ncbi:hypothetical protein F2Q70_00028000 [Brassica cretica]|uniref:Uncharacterized protein n=1 Tax=Brassica cretica TaxID=69181 RepID=A0A8S9LB95_BRACR|nr:hypothetical protein F2Q70_00028000 [Brassica cretica]